MPHSETPGSKRACRSPGLIAADRVLHRLVMPRHPSCARIRLAEDRNPRHSRYVATLLDTQTVQLSKIDPPPLGREIPSGRALPRVFCRQLVGVPGIEPGTSSLSGTRSNQLSYTPASGCRPPRPPEGWWRQPGSNRRHPACKAGALPTELCPRRGTSLSTRVQALFGRAASCGPGGVRENPQLDLPVSGWRRVSAPPRPEGRSTFAAASLRGCSLERR